MQQESSCSSSAVSDSCESGVFFSACPGYSVKCLTTYTASKQKLNMIAISGTAIPTDA